MATPPKLMGATANPPEAKIKPTAWLLPTAIQPDDTPAHQQRTNTVTLRSEPSGIAHGAR